MSKVTVTSIVFCTFGLICGILIRDVSYGAFLLVQFVGFIVLRTLIDYAMKD